MPRPALWRMLAVLLGAALSACLLFGPARAGAATISYPDLVSVVPTEYTFIQHTSKKRTLEFEHITSDTGAGPLEIRPLYNAKTGISQGYQALYSSPSPGTWTFDHTVPIVGPMIWKPPSDYIFPLTKFWLYSNNPNNEAGSIIASSPKTEFCMTSDMFVGAPDAPESNTYPGGACSEPEGTLGLTVGWGDEYDASDGGEGIDISSLANGIYWLRSEVDPYHYFQESNRANDITDTKLKIEGNVVTTLEQTHPDSTPPTVALTSPSAGSGLSGTVTLEASAAGPAPVSSVQFLLDGQPIGSPVTNPPYKLEWALGSTPAGSHFVSAQALDQHGFYGTAEDVPVTVGEAGGGPAESFDGKVSQSGSTSVTTPGLSTTVAGDVLLAFADADGPTKGQSLAVSGGGLSWTRVKRVNSHGGDAEIWWAKATGVLGGATFTATETKSGFDQALTVLALKNAAGIGGSGKRASAGKAPSVTIKTKAAGSMLFATGVDALHDIARSFDGGQSELVQFLDTSAEDTFWTQYSSTRSATAGQKVVLDDIAPSSDPFEMVGAEVTAGGEKPPDRVAPTVQVASPAPKQQLTGTAPVSAATNDNVAIASVQFRLDGRPLGSAVTVPPYALSWNTARTGNGAHTLTAVTTDTSGNSTSSAPVEVSTENPAGDESPCFVMDAKATVEGIGTLTTQPFTTAAREEQLLAFVSSDGPAGSRAQSATVSGAGLTWTPVARANSRSGDAEIWTARAATPLQKATVTSTPATGGYAQSLAVISVQESSGIGASATAGAGTGAPKLSLKTRESGSLVFAVGNDHSRAVTRMLGANQVGLHEYLDNESGETFWSQYLGHVTGAAGTTVRLNDTAPARDEWNMAEVELLGGL